MLADNLEHAYLYKLVYLGQQVDRLHIGKPCIAFYKIIINYSIPLIKACTHTKKCLLYCPSIPSMLCIKAVSPDMTKCK